MWHLLIGNALRGRALHWAMQGRLDIAERMVKLAEIEEAKHEWAQYQSRGATSASC